MFLLIGSRREQHLRDLLTDESLAFDCIVERFFDLCQGTIFKHYPTFGARHDHLMKEVLAQIFAEENPPGIGKTLTDDVQFRGIVDVEERVVDDDNGVTVCFQRLQEPCVVRQAFAFRIFPSSNGIKQPRTRDVLIVSNVKIHLSNKFAGVVCAAL